MFTRKEKVLLGLLAFIQFSSIVDFMIMMPLGPQLMRLFSISPHQFGLLVSSYTFCAGLSGFASSFFIDKFDRKNCLLFFLIGFGIGTVACALSPSYEILIFSRGLTGMFGGVLGSLVMSIVSDTIAYERRGSAMGIVMTSFSLASVFGVPFSLYLANMSGWHTPFVFLGVTALVVCIGIWFVIPQMRGHLDHQVKEPVYRVLTRILKNPNQLQALLFMGSVVFGHFAIIPFMSPSLVANAGLLESHLPLVYMAGGLLTIFTSPYIGRLSDRFGKHRVFFWGALITLLPYFVLTNLKQTSLSTILFTTSFLFVSSGGRMIPASTLVSGTANPQTRGSFMSIVSCVQQMASAVASYVSGIIITRGNQGELENYDIVGYLAIGTTFIAIYLSRKIKATEHLEQHRPELSDV